EVAPQTQARASTRSGKTAQNAGPRRSPSEAGSQARKTAKKGRPAQNPTPKARLPERAFATAANGPAIAAAAGQAPVGGSASVSSAPHAATARSGEGPPGLPRLTARCSGAGAGEQAGQQRHALQGPRHVHVLVAGVRSEE